MLTSTAPLFVAGSPQQLRIRTPDHRARYAGIRQFAGLQLSERQELLFYGDSSDYQTSSPGGSTTSLVYTNDTFIGIDITKSGNPVSLSSSNTPVLLAALTLDTTSTHVGDTYAINLVPPTGTGSPDTGASTYFDNYNFNTGVETSAVPFTSNPGTVTITASAVPNRPRSSWASARCRYWPASASPPSVGDRSRSRPESGSKGGASYDLGVQLLLGVRGSGREIPRVDVAEPGGNPARKAELPVIGVRCSPQWIVDPRDPPGSARRPWPRGRSCRRRCGAIPHGRARVVRARIRARNGRSRAGPESRRGDRRRRSAVIRFRQSCSR